MLAMLLTMVAMLLANLAFSLSARLGNCLADLGHSHRLGQHYKHFVGEIFIRTNWFTFYFLSALVWLNWAKYRREGESAILHIHEYVQFTHEHVSLLLPVVAVVVVNKLGDITSN